MTQWEEDIALTSLESPANLSICHWEEWIFHYVFIIDVYLNCIIAYPLKWLRFDLLSSVQSIFINIPCVI